jgi:hypothetical protein
MHTVFYPFPYSNSSTLELNNENMKLWHDECQANSPPEKEMKDNSQEGTLEGWFKITVSVLRI